MDVIIATEDHPPTFSAEEAGLFFIEGTCACGEIKSVLTTDSLLDSLNKASVYKKLSMIPTSGSMMFANESDGNRFYTTPPFFIFAFRSQLSLERTLDIANNHNKNSYKPGHTADGIFILDKGYLIDLGDGNGSYTIKYGEGISVKGWYGSESDTVLYDFLIWLTVVMPRMLGGTNIMLPYLI